MERIIPVSKMTVRSFAQFGEIIQQPERNADVMGDEYFYWHDLYGDKIDSKIKLGYFRLKKRDFCTREIERHINNAEIFVPVYGRGIMIFIPPADPGDIGSEPGYDKAAAFIIESGTSFLINKGIWHACAMPFEEKLDFLLILPDNVLDEEFCEKREVEPLIVDNRWIMKN
ncbi:MAG: ureidoglycolate lyase [Clostridiales bacterium]|nr:ureidoglycolate lyase [Clostridiales bacterium]